MENIQLTGATLSDDISRWDTFSPNSEAFHPEDDAHDILWDLENVPTYEECEQLNKLMDDIYNLPGNDGKHDNSIAFCPCGFLLDLNN